MIYRNANGDAWYLAPDIEAKRLRVRYQPKQGSGRCASVVDLDEFLSEERGPQREALPRLLQEMGYLLPNY